MEKDFRPLNKIQVLKLSREELIDYYRDLRQYVCENNDKLKGVEFRKIIHPVLRKILTAKRKISRQRVEVMNKRKTKSKRPTIYCITHIGKFDLEIVSENIDDSFYIFSGDPECMYRTLDGYFLELNGVVYADTESKTDRTVAKKTAIKLLNQGGNLLMYPEGVWNLDDHKIILPLFYGTIDIAKETNSVIIPIAIEQYGKEFIINYGKDFEVNDYYLKGQDEMISRSNAKEALRDEMATLKWEIWHTKPQERRKDIPDDYYQNFVSEKLAEWPFYTKELVDSRIYRPKDVVTKEEVFQNVKKLKPNKNNAFLFRTLNK